MKRRSFLSFLGAALAAPALPAYASPAPGRFEIIGQDIVLKRPLIVDTVEEVLISKCRFSKSPDFEGKYLLEFRGNSPSVRIEHCEFRIEAAWSLGSLKEDRGDG